MDRYVAGMQGPRSKNLAASLGLLIVLPLLAHVAFSWIGFNPTDDGFNLALTRRLLDGQVPHRDFISVRPVLSPVLHIPVLLVGGDHTYWVSRLVVWFQFASMAWLWVQIVNRFRVAPISSRQGLAAGLLCVAATVHNFQIMAWHTIDGIWLTSLGMYLCLQDGRRAHWCGYLLLGAAYLCKQSFLFEGPLTCLILGHSRRPSPWLAMLVPGAAYCLFLMTSGALDHFFLQLSTHSELSFYLTAVYLHGYVGWGAILGYVAADLLSDHSLLKNLGLRCESVPAAASALYFGPLFLILCCGLWTGWWAMWGSFLAMGMLTGTVGHMLVHRTEPCSEHFKPALLALSLAWSGSISVGYNAPALGSGPVVLVLLSLGFALCPEVVDRRRFRALMAIGVCLVLASFSFGRIARVYREQPVWFITDSLHGILPGASGIYTNANCHAFLRDLVQAITIAKKKGLKYAVIPDVPGWWARADQANPLPVDWIWITEVERPELVDRLNRSVEEARGTAVIIVQKVEAAFLHEGPRPLSMPRPETVTRIQERFRLVGETAFFTLYE
ncbi:MAG: hypothetical protein AB1646_01305 [Thermodesulfobacteriota bacterium]